jgi:hypothetical protein
MTVARDDAAGALDIAGWVRRAADGNGAAWERQVNQYASLIRWIPAIPSSRRMTPHCRA